jgi:glycosyltransferase involved in cell wall biosynthesis
MRLELLVATLNNRIEHFKEISKKYPELKVTLINQSAEPLQIDSEQFTVKSFQEVGLSKSRNRALESASGDVCVVCDEDVDFTADFQATIAKAYEALPDADLISFQIITPEGEPYKTYKKKTFAHNKVSILRVSSIEVTFKRKSIEKHQLTFDERFGLGSEIKGGEENIFLADALRKGLKLYSFPGPIVIHPKESSNKTIDSDFFFTKGAIMKRINGRQGLVLSLVFLVAQFRKVKKIHQVPTYLSAFVRGYNFKFENE